METTKELVETTDTLVETVNGGLEAAAKSHLQDNEMFISLATRVDRLEREKADEVEAKQAEKAARHACEEALTELREWVVGRLDEIGEGRSEPREGSV